MAYVIKQQNVSPQPVLVERHQVSRPEISATIGHALTRIFQYAQEAGVQITGQPFTRYLDASPDQLTIEPGMRVEALPSQDPSDGIVRRETLPGGRVATTIHSGSYETLHKAYAALEAWIKAEELTPAGAPWETYLTDPTAHPDVSDWRTEICWPVA